MQLYYKLKKNFKANNDVMNGIINSLSYKVGYTITYPIRLIYDFFKGGKTVLYHNSLPANDFENRFEKQWLNLAYSNDSFSYDNQLHFYLEGNIDEFNNNFIRGWYRNRNDKLQRVQIEVYKNKKKITTTICDKYRADLIANNIGDGHYGFLVEFENPLSNIDDSISLQIFSNEPENGEPVKRGELTFEQNSFKLSKKYNDYAGSFDKIIDAYACGWIVNNNNLQKNVNVLLFRNDELINSGKANLYRNDLRARIKGNHNKAYRLKIPLVELLKGKATYTVYTADKFEVGSIEWDPDTQNQSFNRKLNSSKTDWFLPYYNGYTKLNAAPVTQKIAIHIHVFYVDVFEEICSYLKHLSFKYDLYISTPENNLKGIHKCLSKNKIEALKIVSTPNRGRDVAPFIIEFGEDLLQYDVALHLHTKKTTQNATLGKIWFKHLLDCLVKDSTYVNAVLTVFKCFPNIGIIAPKLLNELVPMYNWGKNYKNTLKFLKSLKVDADLLSENEVEFPAGTMFWFQPKALEKLLTFNISYKDFPKEPISGDGSIAHVIERSIYYVAEDDGFTYQTIAPINPNLIHSSEEKVVLSIIIPIYNAEKWLAHAVQSILQQSQFLESFEILLVDNNSTDSSSTISKMFSSMYPNIHYHFQPKKGAGNARNLGIENANGEYLFFLDADDMLDSRALQNLMDLAYDGNSDLITSPLIIFNEKKFNNAVPAYFTKAKISIDIDALKTGASKIDNTVLPYLKAVFSDFGPCAKLYKKEFIEKNNIRFPEGLNYEDNYFIYKAYLLASQISICDEPTYLYRKLTAEKGTTQSTSFKETDISDQCKILLMLIELLNEKENKVLKTIGYQSLIQKLVWMFNGIKELSNPDAVFFPKLSEVLSNFSNSEIENFGGKFVSYFKSVKNKNFSQAISNYNIN